jgi:hypothetical protein
MNHSTRAFVSTFGAIMALAGIEHGIGELLQGGVTPGGVMIQSWPNSAFFRNVGGEPAMTVIPNLQATGILAILLSLALLVWAALFVQRKWGGLVMILISIVLLLAGGGIFPPILAILIGVVATRIHSPMTWWRTHLSPDARQFLASLWPWSFAACVIAWPLMFAGPALLGVFFGPERSGLVWALILLALGTLLSTVLTGFARDTCSAKPSLQGTVPPAVRCERAREPVGVPAKLHGQPSRRDQTPVEHMDPGSTPISLSLLMSSRPETLRPARLAGPARSGSRPQGDKAGEFFARALAATRNGCLRVTGHTRSRVRFRVMSNPSDSDRTPEPRRGPR